MQTSIEKYKGNVKLEIAKLGQKELSFWSVAPAILKILLESVALVEGAMDLSDEKQRQFLVVATEELLEEIDIPGVDNDLEEYIDKQIVKQMPMILEKLLPLKKAA